MSVRFDNLFRLMSTFFLTLTRLGRFLHLKFTCCYLSKLSIRQDCIVSVETFLLYLYGDHEVSIALRRLLWKTSFEYLYSG